MFQVQQYPQYLYEDKQQYSSFTQGLQNVVSPFMDWISVRSQQQNFFETYFSKVMFFFQKIISYLLMNPMTQNTIHQLKSYKYNVDCFNYQLNLTQLNELYWDIMDKGLKKQTYQTMAKLISNLSKSLKNATTDQQFQNKVTQVNDFLQNKLGQYKNSQNKKQNFFDSLSRIFTNSQKKKLKQAQNSLKQLKKATQKQYLVAATSEIAQIPNLVNVNIQKCQMLQKQNEQLNKLTQKIEKAQQNGEIKYDSIERSMVSSIRSQRFSIGKMMGLCISGTIPQVANNRDVLASEVQRYKTTFASDAKYVYQNNIQNIQSPNQLGLNDFKGQSWLSQVAKKQIIDQVNCIFQMQFKNASSQLQSKIMQVMNNQKLSYKKVASAYKQLSKRNYEGFQQMNAKIKRYLKLTKNVLTDMQKMKQSGNKVLKQLSDKQSLNSVKITESKIILSSLQQIVSQIKQKVFNFQPISKIQFEAATASLNQFINAKFEGQNTYLKNISQGLQLQLSKISQIVQIQNNLIKSQSNEIKRQINQLRKQNKQLIFQANKSYKKDLGEVSYQLNNIQQNINLQIKAQSIKTRELMQQIKNVQSLILKQTSETKKMIVQNNQSLNQKIQFSVSTLIDKFKELSQQKQLQNDIVVKSQIQQKLNLIQQKLGETKFLIETSPNQINQQLMKLSENVKKMTMKSLDNKTLKQLKNKTQDIHRLVQIGKFQLGAAMQLTFQKMKQMEKLNIDQLANKIEENKQQINQYINRLASNSNARQIQKNQFIIQKFKGISTILSNLMINQSSQSKNINKGIQDLFLKLASTDHSIVVMHQMLSLQSKQNKQLLKSSQKAFEANKNIMKRLDVNTKQLNNTNQNLNNLRSLWQLQSKNLLKSLSKSRKSNDQQFNRMKQSNKKQFNKIKQMQDQSKFLIQQIIKSNEKGASELHNSIKKVLDQNNLMQKENTQFKVKFDKLIKQSYGKTQELLEQQMKKVQQIEDLKIKQMKTKLQIEKFIATMNSQFKMNLDINNIQQIPSLINLKANQLKNQQNLSEQMKTKLKTVFDMYGKSFNNHNWVIQLGSILNQLQGYKNTLQNNQIIQSNKRQIMQQKIDYVKENLKDQIRRLNDEKDELKGFKNKYTELHEQSVKNKYELNFIKGQFQASKMKLKNSQLQLQGLRHNLALTQQKLSQLSYTRSQVQSSLHFQNYKLLTSKQYQQNSYQNQQMYNKSKQFLITQQQANNSRNQIKILQQEIQKTKREIQRTKGDLNVKINQIQIIKKTNKQLELQKVKSQNNLNVLHLKNQNLGKKIESLQQKLLGKKNDLQKQKRQKQKIQINFKRQNQILQEKLSKEQSQIDKMSNNLKKIQNQQKSKIQEINNKLNIQKQQVQRLKKQQKKKEGKISQLQNQIKQLNSKQPKQPKQLRQVKKQKQNLIKQLEKVRNDLNQSQKNFKRFQQSVGISKKMMQDLLNERNIYQTYAIDLGNKINQIFITKSNQLQIKAKMTNYNQILQNYKNNIDFLKSKLKQIKQFLQNPSEQTEQKYNQSIKQYQKQINDLTSQKRDLKFKYNQLQKELKSLKDQQMLNQRKIKQKLQSIQIQKTKMKQQIKNKENQLIIKQKQSLKSEQLLIQFNEKVKISIKNEGQLREKLDKITDEKQKKEKQIQNYIKQQFQRKNQIQRLSLQLKDLKIKYDNEKQEQVEKQIINKAQRLQVLQQQTKRNEYNFNFYQLQQIFITMQEYKIQLCDQILNNITLQKKVNMSEQLLNNCTIQLPINQQIINILKNNYSKNIEKMKKQFQQRSLQFKQTKIQFQDYNFCMQYLSLQYKQFDQIFKATKVKIEEDLTKKYIEQQQKNLPIFQKGIIVLLKICLRLFDEIQHLHKQFKNQVASWSQYLQKNIDVLDENDKSICESIIFLFQGYQQQLRQTLNLTQNIDSNQHIIELINKAMSMKNKFGKSEEGINLMKIKNQTQKQLSQMRDVIYKKTKQ